MLRKEIDQVKNRQAYFLFPQVEKKSIVSEGFHVFSNFISPSLNYIMDLFGLFLLKNFDNCSKENIFSENEEGQNLKLETNNNEANKKIRIA